MVRQFEIGMIFALGIFFAQNRIIQTLALRDQFLALGLISLAIIAFTGGKPALLATVGRGACHPDPPLSEMERRIVRCAPWLLLIFAAGLAFWLTW